MKKKLLLCLAATAAATALQLLAQKKLEEAAVVEDRLGVPMPQERGKALMMNIGAAAVAFMAQLGYKKSMGEWPVDTLIRKFMAWLNK